jgi:Cys-tRNA(Pro) deacylase
LPEEQVSSPVIRNLDKLSISYRLFRHPGPITSLEQAASERGQITDQVVRSILFRVSQENYVMALIAGSRQVSWPLLRKYLGQSRLTMASPEEVLSVTGYEIGAVSPFGLPDPVRVLVDTSVFEPEEISIGSGIRGVTVIMTGDELRKALGAVEVIDLAQSANASGSGK